MLRRGLRTMVMVGLLAAALVQPSAPASGAPATRLTLTFSPQPADAKAGEALTGTAFEPDAAPVRIVVKDGSKIANVKETFAVYAVLGTTETLLTTVTTDAGIAALSMTAPAPGQKYHLLARSDDLGDTTSADFDTYEQAQRCRNANGPTCTVDIDRPQVMHVQVSAGTTSGALALNIGALPFGTCGVNNGDLEVEHHAPGLVVQDEAGINVDKLAVMTIAKEIVQQRSDNGASFYSVCFSKDGVQFTTLPDCPPAKKRTEACVVSKNKTGAGAVEITIFLPKGDPTWW